MEFPTFKNVCNKPGIELLPHRSPFLFVDRLLSADETGAIGEVVFGPDQYFFKGHFPDYPVVPGVILIEAMAQTAGAGLVASGLFGDDVPLFFLAGVDDVRFRRQVRPGDKLTTVSKIAKIAHGLGTFELKGYVGEKLAAQAIVKCMLGAVGDAKKAVDVNKEIAK